jgi:hypothetical protein
MSSEIVAAFSPNDFFYVKAKKTKWESELTDSSCSILLDGPSIPQDCDAKPTTECINAQLCLNKRNVNKLYNLQNSHGGSDQRYLDIKAAYNYSLFNCFNLGVSIIITVGFIYTKYIYIKTPV